MNERWSVPGAPAVLAAHGGRGWAGRCRRSAPQFQGTAGALDVEYEAGRRAEAGQGFRPRVLALVELLTVAAPGVVGVQRAARAG